MSLLLPREAAEKRLESDCYVEGYATTFDDPYVLYEYDGAALAPYLPNCLEMQGVTVFGEGGSIVVSYLPSEPGDCTGVALSCMDGQVVAVTAGWGEFGAGYADLLTGEVTVEEW